MHQLEIWAEKDYQDKTGAAVRAEITSWSDTEYEITLTDKDENTLYGFRAGLFHRRCITICT